MSSPIERPKATASLVAASAVADRKLLASFSACAIPAGRRPGSGRRSGRRAPTRRPRTPRTGEHHRQRAGAGPGDAARHRGVDVDHRPLPSSRASIDRAAATPMVDVSTTWGRPAARTRDTPATASDTAPSGRLSTTTSAPRAMAATSATNTCALGAALGTGHVDVERHVEIRADEVGGEGGAHVPEPDDSDDVTGRRSRPASLRSARTPAAPASPPPRPAPALGRDLEQQLVELVVGHARRRTPCVEPELLHPPEGGGHGQHEQAAVAHRQGPSAGPHAPTPST